MVTTPARSHVLIAPRLSLPLGSQNAAEAREALPRHADIAMTWAQDEFGFRLDIDLPESSMLDLVFSEAPVSVHVNGETIWADQCVQPILRADIDVEVLKPGLRLSFTSSGQLHVLARAGLET